MRETESLPTVREETLFKHYNITNQETLSAATKAISEKLSPEYQANARSVLNEEVINAVFRGKENEIYSNVNNETVTLRSKSLGESFQPIALKLLQYDRTAEQAEIDKIKEELEAGNVTALNRLGECGRGTGLMINLTAQITFTPEEISFHFANKHTFYPTGRVVVVTPSQRILTSDGNGNITEITDGQAKPIEKEEIETILV